MAARGMFFGEGPTACPFVALESDRDRRSDEPDHRHRCYAEPDPAPRALAHQREYCLAAAFSACPIFQDWAIRAAATPVPLRPGRMQDVERDEQPLWAAPPPWLGTDRPEEAGEESAASGPERQLAVEQAAEEPAASQPATNEPAARQFSAEDLAGDRPVPEFQPGSRRPVTGPTPAQPAEDGQPAPLIPPPMSAPDEDIARIPSRSALEEDEIPDHSRTEARRIRAPRNRAEREAQRDEIVAPWQRQPVYQTRSRVKMPASSDLLSRLTTLLAIGFILALAVVAILVAPALLDGLGGEPGATQPAAGGSPTVSPAATATPRPSPTPTPSPRTYTVAAGDTLFAIARRHGLTVEQLLAANPQITNPNVVTIGQVLFIPEDDFGLFTPSPAP